LIDEWVEGMKGAEDEIAKKKIHPNFCIFFLLIRIVVCLD
jgi:hypothetical protein